MIDFSFYLFVVSVMDFFIKDGRVSSILEDSSSLITVRYDF